MSGATMQAIMAACEPVILIERHTDRRADGERREHGDARPGHRHAGALRADRGDRPGDAAGDELALAEAGDQAADDDDGEAQSLGKARHGRDEIEQPAQRADRRALQSRALAAMVVGQPARIAARQHRREELDADHQPDDQIAEAQLVVDEQRITGSGRPTAR
jgi:hypothetical protein